MGASWDWKGIYEQRCAKMSKYPITLVNISPNTLFINSSYLWRWTRVLGLSSWHVGSARCRTMASTVPQEQSDGAGWGRQTGCQGQEWRVLSEGSVASRQQSVQIPKLEFSSAEWVWESADLLSLMLLFRKTREWVKRRKRKKRY